MVVTKLNKMVTIPMVQVVTPVEPMDTTPMSINQMVERDLKQRGSVQSMCVTPITYCLVQNIFSSILLSNTLHIWSEVL